MTIIIIINICFIAPKHGSYVKTNQPNRYLSFPQRLAHPLSPSFSFLKTQPDVRRGKEGGCGGPECKHKQTRGKPLVSPELDPAAMTTTSRCDCL